MKELIEKALSQVEPSPDEKEKLLGLKDKILEKINILELKKDCLQILVRDG